MHKGYNRMQILAPEIEYFTEDLREIGMYETVCEFIITESFKDKPIPEIRAEIHLLLAKIFGAGKTRQKYLTQFNDMKRQIENERRNSY